MAVKAQVEKAIEDITYFTKKFPEEGFKVLSENREEAIPRLMNALKKAIEEKDELEEEYQLHFYALFLLAQFGYKPAFPLVLEMISLPEEVLDFLIGDTVTGGLNDILYSVYDGDFERLRDYIINAECSSYAKAAGLEVCVRLYLDGIMGKEDIVNLFKTLIYHPVIADDYMLDTLMIGCICDCHLVLMLPDIKYLYEQERVDLIVYGEYDSCVDLMFEYGENGRDICQRIENAADYLRHWAMFEQDDRKKTSKKDYEKFMHALNRGINQSEKGKKVYPNDLCPCGSGKKYKKCCMHKSKEKLEIQSYKEDRNKWLWHYPKKAQPRVKGRVYLEDYYDQESIEIDTLVYLALMHRPGLPSERETEAEMNKRQRMYLQEAFIKYAEKCEREDIQSFKNYDSNYMIHYKSEEWMEYLAGLLKKDSKIEEYKKVKNFFFLYRKKSKNENKISNHYALETGNSEYIGKEPFTQV